MCRTQNVRTISSRKISTKGIIIFIWALPKIPLFFRQDWLTQKGPCGVTHTLPCIHFFGAWKHHASAIPRTVHQYHLEIILIFFLSLLIVTSIIITIIRKFRLKRFIPPRNMDTKLYWCHLWLMKWRQEEIYNNYITVGGTYNMNVTILTCKFQRTLIPSNVKNPTFYFGIVIFLFRHPHYSHHHVIDSISFTSCGVISTFTKINALHKQLFPQMKINYTYIKVPNQIFVRGYE